MAVFDAIVSALAAVLQALYGFTGSYTIAIVLLTALVRVALHPLTRKQFSSMKAMQALAPQLEVLKRKYGHDPKQLNVETMNLYRASKVNPFSGCFPMLVQLPILWALFAMLRRPDIFGNETLLGIPLGTTPTFELILQHPALALIPLLTGVTTYLQQHVTVTDPQQTKMFIFFPFMLAYTSTLFAVALSVYWISSTVMYTLEYLIIGGRPKRIGVAPPKSQRAALKTKRNSSG